jgi:hypothetical protein
VTIDIRTVHNQQPHNVHMILSRRHDDGRVALLVDTTDVGAEQEEQARHLRPALSTRVQQRRITILKNKKDKNVFFN